MVAIKKLCLVPIYAIVYFITSHYFPVKVSDLIIQFEINFFFKFSLKLIIQISNAECRNRRVLL